MAFVGILIFFMGFIFVGIFGSIFDGGNSDNSFLSSIVFAILFLCSTIAICTISLIKALKLKN